MNSVTVSVAPRRSAKRGGAAVGFGPDARLDALAGQLRALADWLGLADLQLHGPADVLREAVARH